MPLIQKFQAGFEAGAKAVNPKIKVEVKYLTQPPDFTGFNDPAKGKTTAAGMYDAGADIVYRPPAAPAPASSRPPRPPRSMAIGVDSDQYKTRRPDGQGRHPDLDAQAGRRRGVRLHQAASTTASSPAGTDGLRPQADGVGYSTSGGQVDDIKTKLDDYKQKIIDGKITVPTK